MSLSPQQSIDELRKRHDTLYTQKNKTEAHLENSERLLAELKQKALAQYQTADLAELQALLDGMRRDNESKRAAYQQHLDDIDTKLKALEESSARGTR